MDIARTLKDTLFGIIRDAAPGELTATQYGGVKVATPEGERVAWLRLSFEGNGRAPAWAVAAMRAMAAAARTQWGQSYDHISATEMANITARGEDMTVMERGWSAALPIGHTDLADYIRVARPSGRMMAMIFDRAAAQMEAGA